MVERLRVAGGLIALSSMALFVNACEGGCFTEAGPVVVQPATQCLQLFVGNSEDGTICGLPDLQGTNACSETLILPPPAPGNADQRAAPGAAVRYLMDPKSPGIRLVHGDDNTNWIINAMLGEQPIAITVGIHEK